MERPQVLDELPVEARVACRVLPSTMVIPSPSEREIFIDNLLVRVRLIIEMSRLALRHGSLNSLFQVALYLPLVLSLKWSVGSYALP